MSEETKETPEMNAQPGSSQESTWQDVGQQFKVLGESLAQAFRATWENEENQRRMHEMRSGLESMAQNLGKAIDETAQSPQGQQFKADAEKTMEKLRAASEQTVQEVRPQLITALQQLNNELQKLVDKMQTREQASPPKDNDPGPQA
jgi:uncharacterized membrane protein YccC